MAPWRWLLLWCWHTALLHGQRPQDGPPRPAGWSPAPSPPWGPTEEPGDAEGSAAALAFLRTGDARRLARANCSRGVPAAAAGPGPPPALRAALRAAPEALAHAANFLNMLFQTNDIREASVAEDVEWYQALVRSLAEGHPWVRRAVLALDAHPLAAKPRLMLQATKGDGQILLQDVSAAAPSLGNLSWDNEWFNAPKSQRTPALRKRVLSNDLRSMETPKWQRGDSYVGDPGHVRWSPPFLECRDGRFLPAWAVTLSAAFYGLKPDLSPEFKGVVRVDIELRDVAIDQCASGPGWFADTHRCDLNSTQCIPQESHGFVLGRYLCRCKPGFYGASGAAQAGTAGADGGSLLGCRPCRQGCSTCQDDAPCLIQEDRALRAAVLSCQACCMLAIFLSMLVSYHFRRSKRIRASGIILLETILFGSLLLYFPVFILYFKPSIFRCIVLRWVRMLGFTIVYGTITLKLYRVLKVFLSRTAQRVPYVSSMRVLKMLGLILVLVLWFLAAWTIGMLENVDKNIPLVIRTQTAGGLHFYICGHDHWDYMMVIAELLFLLWGSFLCFATRAVPSAFHEPRYMGIALHNELMISATFHVVRFIVVPSLHPDWTLLLFFAHTHGTITMTLALLFIPKFLHTGSPLREEITAEVYEDELDMRRSGSCLNSSIASAWSEHSLDPDDIREELKKLYRQLEVHRRWRMAALNPHLPKQRSARRSLARSIAHRVTELPEALARRRRSSSTRGSSAKQLLNAGTTDVRMRDDGSRSTEGVQGGSPILAAPQEPAPGRKMMVTAASEQSDSESLDAAPLVYKSASAHNLVGHGHSPLPRAPPLHKSLSVVAGAQDEALLAASRAAWGKEHIEHPFSLASGHPTAQGPPKEDGKPQSPDADAVPSPAEGCSRSVSPLGDGRVQRHVTYAPIKSISVDGSHHPGRVRMVVVRRTPPRPPVRCQSLGQRGPAAGDSLGTAEPPVAPPAAGMKEEDAGCTSPAASIPAQVCPWELVQEEILSRRERATQAAGSGTTSDTAATPPSIKPSAQKMSLWSLGLAIKAFNRSRGKSIPKGKRESEGSLRKRRGGSSRRERPSPAETSAVSPAGTTGSEQGFCQHNNNARAAAGDGEEPGEEQGAPHGDADAGHRAPSSSGHQEGAERPHEPPVVVAQPQPQQGDEAPVATPKEGLEGPSGSIPCQDHTEVEQPRAGPSASSSHPSISDGQRAAAEELEAEVWPQGALDGPAGTVCQGEGSSHPEPLGPRDIGKVPARRWSEEMAPVGRKAQVYARDNQADSSIKTGICLWEESREDPQHPREELGMEKPSANLSELLEGPLQGRRGQVCPWETLEEGRTTRAATGPWDAEGAEPEQEGQEAERRWVGERGKSIRARSLGVVGAPKPPKPGPSSFELPEGIPKSARASVCPWEATGADGDAGGIRPWEGGAAASNAGKAEDGDTSQGENGISPQAAAPGGTGGMGLAADKGSTQQGCPCPGEGAGQRSTGLAAGHPALPKAESKHAGAMGSSKASVCPWEAEVEPLAKAEICPWEEPEAPWGKDRARQDTRGTSKGGNKPVTRGLEGVKAKLAEVGGHHPEHRKSRSFANLIRKSMESPKAKSKKSQSAESIKEEVCPWESLGTEQPMEHPRARSPALPSAPPRASQSGESLKAEVCPWEAPGTQSMDKAEICPWEGAAAPSGKEELRQDKDALSIGRKSPSTTEGAFKGIEHHKSAKEKASMESLKAEVCPWEAPGAQSMDKAEICPWEVAPAPSGTEELRQDKDALSIGTKSPSTMEGAFKGIGHRTSAEEKASMESLKAEVCPWEAPGTQSMDKAEICPWEGAAAPSATEESRQDKDALSIGRKSPSTTEGAFKGIEHHKSAKEKASMESLKAEVCPWEAPGAQSMDTAEICPWEGAAAPSQQLKPKQGPGGVPKGDKRIRRQAALASPGRALERGSSKREAACPWESLDKEQPMEHPRARSPALPRAPPRASESRESLKAEVCPWEAPGAQSMDKAEICPWEVAAAPLGTEESRQDKDALSRGRKSPSTTEGAFKGIGHRTSAEEKGSVESLKAEVCPWEAPGTQSMDKAEICPWEVAAAPSGKEESRQDKDALSIGTKSPSTTEGAFKGIGHRTSAEEKASMESLKAEVCPWEAPGAQSMDKAEICPWEVAAAPSGKEESRQDKDALSIGTKSPSTSEGAFKGIGHRTSAEEKASMESLKAEVCPWEAPGAQSMDTAEICPWEVAPAPSGKEESREDKDALSIGTKSPSTTEGAFKGIGHRTSAEEKGSVESLKAEVCPWEAPGTQSMDKAEICPWEVAAAPSGKEESRQDKDALSIGTKSPSTTEGAFKGIGHRTSAEEKASMESLKAEVCPWEAPGAQSMDKAEICPWEVAAAPSGKEESRQDKDALSIGTKSPSTTEGAFKGIGHRTSAEEKASMESLKAEVCPWEAPGAQSMDKAEICPWEGAAGPSQQQKPKQGPGGVPKGDKRIRRQAALASPGRALERGSSKREAACPWESLDKEQPMEHPRARSPALPRAPPRASESMESLKAEVCPWEAPGAQSMDKAEICPWEVAAAPSGKEEPREDKDALSIGTKSPLPREGAFKGIGHSMPAEEKASMESLKAEVCPWEAPGTQSMDKAEICPWEGAAAPSGKEESREDKDALSIGTKSPSPSEGAFKGIGHRRSAKEKGSVESLKAEVCPWEAPGAQSMDTAEICPWEGAAAPSRTEESRQDKDALSIGTKSPLKSEGACREIGHSTPAKKKKANLDLESICPWESLDTEEQSLRTTGKEPSKKSDSTESRKAEICPWEAAEPSGSEKELPQGADGASSPGMGESKVVLGASTVSPPAPRKKPKGRPGSEAKHKPLSRIQPRRGPGAELLPWAAGTAPGTGSSPSPAEVCPLEAEEAPPADDKTSTDGRKTSAVCPWEMESADATQSGTKADICPWDHE
ncbi:probable G-protein coupled receptor 179 [Pezoporus flaviventris]|uniref:probable G-protein coupled receptor 179 n=1 Tax=Pezoporus flaviventris TaxID=889875 RepID=UPI002AB0F39E|nr:probable G-protein coupled receptor 179 [Pezoporus flaviventris]